MNTNDLIKQKIAELEALLQEQSYVSSFKELGYSHKISTLTTNIPSELRNKLINFCGANSVDIKTVVIHALHEKLQKFEHDMNIVIPIEQKYSPQKGMRKSTALDNVKRNLGFLRSQIK